MKAISLLRCVRRLAAVLALVVLGNMAPAAELPAALTPEAKFLPDNSQMIGVVRVKELLDSPAYRQFKKAAPQCAMQETTIAGNLPMPLDQIDRLVFAGGVTGGGEDEGLWVVHTRAKIVPQNVPWATTRFDLPVKEKVGKYEMYGRRTESYAIVADDLLVFGKAALLRSVLERDRAATIATALEAVLKDADQTATVLFALDVATVRAKRRGEPLPFIPGLQIGKAEGAANALAVTAKCGDQIELTVAALAAADDGVTKLKDEANRFADFQRTWLKQDRNAPEEVIAIFKLNIAGEGKRVTASTRFAPAAAAQLLRLLTQ